MVRFGTGVAAAGFRLRALVVRSLAHRPYHTRVVFTAPKERRECSEPGVRRHRSVRLFSIALKRILFNIFIIFGPRH